MDRKEFLITCGRGCLGLLIGAPLLNGCAGTRHYDASIVGTNLIVPLSEFNRGGGEYRSYVIARNATLQHPISLFRFSETEYTALSMRCTHKGVELQVLGDRLHCPAHGSEFSDHGDVLKGPAKSALRTFPVQIDENNLNIDLT